MMVRADSNPLCLSETLTWISSLLLAAGLLGAAGCATTSNGRWSGELARTYGADVSAVVNATTKAFRDIGMGVDTRQTPEGTYIVEATKESGTSYGSRGVQLTGLSVYVRDLGELGTNLQIRIPEEHTSYASRRSENYGRKQARRVLTLLDQQFSESAAVR